MMKCAFILGVASFVACGNERTSPTAPTPAPVVVIQQPTPTPAATPYSGTWSGSYVIERCDGTGSVQDLFCSGARGFFPVGTSLPIRIELTQSGSNVSGLVSFGQIRGPITGTVRPGGQLTMQGTATSSDGLSLLITYWDTAWTSATEMGGFINYDARDSRLPGIAAVRTRLSNVRK